MIIFVVVVAAAAAVAVALRGNVSQNQLYTVPNKSKTFRAVTTMAIANVSGIEHNHTSADCSEVGSSNVPTFASIATSIFFFCADVLQTSPVAASGRYL